MGECQATSPNPNRSRPQPPRRTPDRCSCGTPYPWRCHWIPGLAMAERYCAALRPGGRQNCHLGAVRQSQSWPIRPSSTREIQAPQIMRRPSYKGPPAIAPDTSCAATRCQSRNGPKIGKQKPFSEHYPQLLGAYSDMMRLYLRVRETGASS